MANPMVDATQNALMQRQSILPNRKSTAITLFHYCAPQTFHAVISNRSIWLSSLFMANDTKEGALVPEVLARMARKDNLPEPSVERLERAVKDVAELADGLAFCLSTKGDLLSQWRGYAADGTGFALGFDSTRLNAICHRALDKEQRLVSLSEVFYEATAQERVLQNAYGELKGALAPQPEHGNVHQSALEKLAKMTSASVTPSNPQQEFAQMAYPDVGLGPDDLVPSELVSKATRTLVSLFRLKNEAFAEENEYRVLELHFRGDPAHYRHANGKIIPYNTIELSEDLDGCLTRVILGPKNQTPIWIVKSFLASAGFKNVDISISAATYR